jgi:hypothetical protein
MTSANMLVCAGFNATAAVLAYMNGKVATATNGVFENVFVAQTTATACAKLWVVRLYLARIHTLDHAIG